MDIMEFINLLMKEISWVQQSNSPNLLGWSTTGSDSDGQAWYDLAFAVLQMMKKYFLLEE